MYRSDTADFSPEQRRAPSLLNRVLGRIERWQDLARQRDQLARLDQRTLRDIGISHYDARQEARRRFWDEP